MSGILVIVREMSGILIKAREMSGECQEISQCLESGHPSSSSVTEHILGICASIFFSHLGFSLLTFLEARCCPCFFCHMKVKDNQQYCLHLVVTIVRSVLRFLTSFK
jgi:hypothetical protein